MLDLRKSYVTMRLRWLWYQWKDPNRMWVSNSCEELDKDFFHAVITLTLGGGRKAPFWHSPWVEGGGNLKILPPSSLRFPPEEVPLFRTRCIITCGCRESTSAVCLLFCTFNNSMSFVGKFSRCGSLREPLMTLPGNLWHRRSTRFPRPTRRCSPGPFPLA